MNGVQFQRLIGDARAFRQSAWLIENEILRLKARQGDLSPIGGPTGWPSHNVWESLKTASHFNLAVSLELRLKCLLYLHDIDPLRGHDGHCLAKLFVQFSETDSATKARLEELFRQATQNHPFTLVAFLSTDTTDTPNGPRNRQLNTLIDFFEYMDDDVELWKKRYSWENAATGKWQHYIDDLGGLFEFLDTTENLATEMARIQGIVH